MHLHACESSAQVAEAGADLVASVLEAVAEPVLLVPAGSTPIALYAELVRRHVAGELDLSGAYLVQLDELVGVAPDDARGFQHFLRAHLAGPAGLDEARLVLLDGTASDPEREIARHAARLAELGGGDLALLGLGTNGHVAFNEPGSTRTSAARVCSLAEPTRTALGATFEAPPTHGLTLGLAELFDCARLALLATGAGKAGVLAACLDGPPRPELPASLLTAHRAFHVIADAPARASLAVRA